MKKKICILQKKSSVIWAESHSRSSTELFGRTKHLVGPVNDRKYVFHFRPKPKPKPEKHLALGRIPKPKPKVQIYVKIGGILLKFNVSNDLSN